MPNDFETLNDNDLLDLDDTFATDANDDLFQDDPFQPACKPEKQKSGPRRPWVLVLICLIVGALVSYIVFKVATPSHHSESATISVTNPEPTADSQTFGDQAENLLVQPKDSDGIPQRVVNDVKPVEFKPDAAPVVTKPKPLPTTTTTSATTTATSTVKAATATISGKWQVQLISLSSQKAVEQERARLQSKHPNLFSGKNLTITEKTLPGGKITYRLRVDGFAEQSSADAFCRQAKQNGIDCYVVPQNR